MFQCIHPSSGSEPKANTPANEDPAANDENEEQDDSDTQAPANKGLHVGNEPATKSIEIAASVIE